MKKLTIAIDGPVASGKSTVARRVAELLGYLYLDSGAMYRAVALKALRAGVPLDDAAELERLARETRIELVAGETGDPGPKAPDRSRKGHGRNAGAESPTPYATCVLLDGEDVTRAIRSAECAQAASKVAEHAGVRKHLVTEQRRLGAGGGVVMEGRDIGTAVFPGAELKIYLDASVEERARRRLGDHTSRGEAVSLEQMMEAVGERDRRDLERKVSPLVRAEDAVYIDSTALDVEEVARLIALLANRRAATQPSGKVAQ